MAAAEAVTPGAWAAISEPIPHPASTARWWGSTSRRSPCAAPSGSAASCGPATVPLNDRVVGQPTVWPVAGLADPSRWTVTAATACRKAQVDGPDLVVSTLTGAPTYTVRR